MWASTKIYMDRRTILNILANGYIISQLILQTERWDQGNFFSDQTVEPVLVHHLSPKLPAEWTRIGQEASGEKAVPYQAVFGLV